MNLPIKSIIELYPTLPFNFDATFYKPDHFPSQDNDWTPGIKWQTMNWNGQQLGLKFIDKKEKIQLEVFSIDNPSKNFIEELKKELIWRYNLGLNISAFYDFVGKDRLVGSSIDNLKGMRPMCAVSLYEYLIISITLQNTPVRRSISMMQSLFEKYGTLLAFDGKALWCFWNPTQIKPKDEMALRDLKLGYRAKSIVRLSDDYLQKSINEKLLRTSSEQELIKVLLSLYGIGPASVGYLMFDVFHHWNYLRHISPWEQKLYTQMLLSRDYESSLAQPKELTSFIDNYEPWRMMVVHYLWENLWWRRHYGEKIDWLEKQIRN